MINERAQTRELVGRTEGCKPKNLQVGRLEITEEKARRRPIKRKKKQEKEKRERERERERESVILACAIITASPISVLTVGLF